MFSSSYKEINQTPTPLLVALQSNHSVNSEAIFEKAVETPSLRERIEELESKLAAFLHPDTILNPDFSLTITTLTNELFETLSPLTQAQLSNQLSDQLSSRLQARLKTFLHPSNYILNPTNALEKLKNLLSKGIELYNENLEKHFLGYPPLDRELWLTRMGYVIIGVVNALAYTGYAAIYTSIPSELWKAYGYAVVAALGLCFLDKQINNFKRNYCRLSLKENGSDLISLHALAKLTKLSGSTDEARGVYKLLYSLRRLYNKLEEKGLIAESVSAADGSAAPHIILPVYSAMSATATQPEDNNPLSFSS